MQKIAISRKWTLARLFRSRERAKDLDRKTTGLNGLRLPHLLHRVHQRQRASRNGQHLHHMKKTSGIKTKGLA